MWGHYADSGNGVCIVLNKEKLLAKLSKYDCYYGNIEYVENYDNTLNGDDVKKNIDYYWFENFFIKTNDWQYEHEFRILKKAEGKENEYMDINGCIDCVIINRAKDISHNDSVFKSSQYIALTKIYHQEYIYEYGVSLDGYKALSGYGRENFIWSEKGDGWKIDLTDQ